jgi:molybdate transport system substrate-binding protein
MCAPRSLSSRGASRHSAFVYGTDARSEPAVKVVGTFPEDSHPKILYPIALTASAKPEARKFLEFLMSSEAAPSFEAQGFSIEGKVG